MTLLGIVLNLLILAVLLWIVSMCLEMVISGSGLPAQIKPIVLAVVGLIGLVVIFSGWRVFL